MNRHSQARAEAEQTRRWWTVYGLSALGLALFLAVATALILKLPGRERLVAVPVLVHAPAKPLPADRPGATLGGQYRIEGELPAGPFGPQFRAVDISLGRRVLLKRLRDELHENEKELDRLLQLARKASELKHAHLAEVYSVFIEDKRVHLAVEWTDGRWLRELIDPDAGTALPALKRVARQLLMALGHAHDKSVLHGGLSPDAIAVDPGGLVKVHDFALGIEASRAAAKRNWGGGLGTVPYMAPEQELGTVYKESDLYSAGALIYELATGRPPFPGPDTLSQKRAARFEPASKLAAGLPAALDTLIAKALAPEPAARFRSADDMRTALELIPEEPGLQVL